MKLMKTANIFLQACLLLAFQPLFCQNPSKADKNEAKLLFNQVENARAKGYSQTQSQAHMSVPEIQQLILKKTEGLAKNKEIIDKALKQEQRYKKNYYVFYTAIPLYAYTSRCNP